jgi:membrane protein YdbS with pleckstrin-like domain
VRGLRFRGSIEPDQLEVRNGLLGRRVVLIPVERVEDIMPEQKPIVLRSQEPPAEPDPL